MLLVFLGICIVWIVVSIIALGYLDELAAASAVLGAVALAVVVVAIGFVWHGLVNARTLDDRIAMYEEENQEIETQIAECVEKYMAYEEGVFEGVSSESAITLVSLYPELKADTLVQKQIEVYVANNEKIKELKEEKITVKNKKWWLYFGGRE